jgi:hypothetical protein
MSVLMACMGVAHNLHLRMVDEERQRKGLLPLHSTPGGHRSDPREQAMTAIQQSISPTGASRAPWHSAKGPSLGQPRSLRRHQARGASFT